MSNIGWMVYKGRMSYYIHPVVIYIGRTFENIIFTMVAKSWSPSVYHTSWPQSNVTQRRRKANHRMQKIQSDRKSLQTLVVWIFDEKGFDMLGVDEQKQPHVLGEGEMENIVLKDLVQSLWGSLTAPQNLHNLINNNSKVPT